MNDIIKQVVAGIFLLILTPIIAYFGGWWPEIVKFFEVTGGWFMQSTQVNNGLLILMIAIIFCGVFLSYILIRRSIKNKKDNIQPIFLEYKQDNFKGLMYRWEYIQSNKQYRIGRTDAYCSTCVSPIVNNKCQQCETVFWDMKDREEVIAMIRYSVETKFKINEFEALGESSDV